MLLPGFAIWYLDRVRHSVLRYLRGQYPLLSQYQCSMRYLRGPYPLRTSLYTSASTDVVCLSSCLEYTYECTYT